MLVGFWSECYVHAGRERSLVYIYSTLVLCGSMYVCMLYACVHVTLQNIIRSFGIFGREGIDGAVL